MICNVLERVLNHNFVGRYREVRLPCKLLLHRFHDVVWEEWLSVILANISVRYKARLAAQIARELTTDVVLDDDGVFRTLQQVEDRVTMQRHQPAYR